MILNVVVSKAEDEPWFVAHCVEVDVASQGLTVDEALANVKEALELYFEDEDPAVVPPGMAQVEVRQLDVKIPA